jgi:hypothetical protein
MTTTRNDAGVEQAIARVSPAVRKKERPVPKAAKVDKLQRLKDLSASPEIQVDYALTLIASELRQDIVEEALAVLATAPGDARVRPALLEAYSRFESGSGRGDQGCYGRMALLRALRPLARREDAALLAHEASTYEFLPPGRSEVAASLRSTALVVLNDVDEQLAAYHAVRLLTDQHTSPLSGEPAITAAQTLAMQGQYLPLYGYAVRTDATSPEIVAECLRSLKGVPLSLLQPLVDRYIASPHEIVVLGLFDLLLEYPERQAFLPLIVQFLHETKLIDIYRWLVSTALTSREPKLIAAIKALEREENDPRKLEILHGAFSLR